MGIGYRAWVNAPLPAASFVVTMLLLLLATLGKKAPALIVCALVPFLLGGYEWYREFDMNIVPVAVFLGLIPGAVLAIGLHMWSSPHRPRSARRALARAAGCGLLLCAVAFYFFLTTDCVHWSNGLCDEIALFLTSAVATSWPLGVVISALLSPVRIEPLPWEK